MALYKPADFTYQAVQISGSIIQFDRDKGARDERKNLGGDIMIHGSNASIGCMAIGNTAIEELYALASDSDYRRW